MRIKLITLLVLLSATLFLSGCDRGQSQMGKREANLLGVAKVERADFTPTELSSISVSTDEIYTRKNFSGDKLTLFWGLITIKDY